MSKLKAGETAVRVTERAVQLLGGYGYIRDFPVERWARDAKIYTIFEGTSEIQRLVIARALSRGARLVAFSLVSGDFCALLTAAGPVSSGWCR